MENSLYVYIYAILVLLIVFIAMNSSKQMKRLGHNYFNKIVLFTLLMLVFDMCHELLDGYPGVVNAIAMRFFSVLIYAFPSIIAGVWLFYVYELIYLKKPKIDIIMILILLPLIINVFVSFLSLFVPLFFYITSTNEYVRGSIFIASLLILYVYMIVPIFIVITNKRRLQYFKFYPLVFFTIPPMIGGIIQAFNYGILILWPMFSLSIFVMYVFIQTKLIALDYLTGLMNKGAFENYVSSFNINRKNSISIIMMDLDGLKIINDTYGHLIGDEVLRVFATACIESFDKRDYIARIGGDEFVVVSSLSNKEEIKMYLDKLNFNLRKIGLINGMPDTLSYSYGFDIYDPKKESSLRSLIESADQKMYINKAQKKCPPISS
jgi:diguanylate cyclase (GGDEF)-like protein